MSRLMTGNRASEWAYAKRSPTIDVVLKIISAQNVELVDKRGDPSKDD
jgi:hypothetical protein